MSTCARLLVNVPASDLRAGQEVPLSRATRMAACPSWTILKRADTGAEVSVPSDGYEVNARVFVYGTLRQGFGNHRLLEQARYLGEAKTVPGFLMHDLGHFPTVVPCGAGAITGEVYEVNLATLARLNSLEGVATGFYRRVSVKLHSWVHRRTAWMYVQDNPSGEPIVGGDWRAHKTMRREVMSWR